MYMEKRFIARAPLSTTSHRRCASLLRVRIAGPAPLPASKQKQSDISLRSRRRKCVISTGSSSCTFCVSRGVACTNGTLALSPKSGNSPRGHGPVVSTPSTPSEQIPDKFSKNQAFAGIKVWERSTGFAKEAAQLLDVCDLSLVTIQACVLLGTLNRTEGQGALETIHYSVACRMAQLLDLPNRPAENAIERELNLRVWWTLSKVDVWSSAGVGLPRQMPPIDDFPLPVDEDTFRSWKRDIPVSVTDSNTDRKSSLFAQMLILTRILLAQYPTNTAPRYGREHGGTWREGTGPDLRGPAYRLLPLRTAALLSVPARRLPRLAARLASVCIQMPLLRHLTLRSARPLVSGARLLRALHDGRARPRHRVDGPSSYAPVLLVRQRDQQREPTPHAQF
ncbi:hypothetical protein BP6252_03276 [Coleophoma cylindrospora]|uniref:Xylanolytic transcriptional activator regulatory domain-containing protein n=1 Tax=Coleophoma cylindrospora TaxID=1849047 RepID=A0A3D8S7W8_9HELO|nr:hypothetical protein BP6252_03276 [Coleophoma cylindrospora]